jgi:hypothetical protein
MEKFNENKENPVIFKFFEKNDSIPDRFSEKLKQFVKKLKVLTKSERINFLNATLGVSPGLLNLIKD